MPAVVCYFQIHQPYRLRRYSVFDTDRLYFDDAANAAVLRKVANKCYVLANAALLETIRKSEGRFRFAFSVTGVALERFQLYAPEVVEGLRKLADTGCVDGVDPHAVASTMTTRAAQETPRRRRAWRGPRVPEANGSSSDKARVEYTRRARPNPSEQGERECPE